MAEFVADTAGWVEDEGLGTSGYLQITMTIGQAMVIVVNLSEH